MHFCLGILLQTERSKVRVNEKLIPIYSQLLQLKLKEMPRGRKKPRGAPQLLDNDEVASVPGDDINGVESEVEVIPGFPDVIEVWLNMFDKLAESDKAPFSRASSDWHDCVASKRVRFLISELAPILMESLPQKNLLQCREFCRSWTHEFDRQSLSHPSHLSLDFEIGERDNPRIPKFVNSFPSIEKIQGFMEDMENHPDSPFPGGTIDLDWNAGGWVGHPQLARLWPNYWRNVMELLDKFGTHVDFATICVCETHSIREMLENVKSCLLRMPNLRGLKLCGNNGCYDNYVGNLHMTIPQPENLETLELQWVSEPILEAILRGCFFPAKIKRLNIQANPKDTDFWLLEHIYQFKNLEVLKAPLRISDLQRLGNTAKCLTKLELQLKPSEESTVMPSMQQLFTTLEAFAQSLIHFKVRTTMAVPFPATMLKINLPQLERVEFMRYDGPLDPLVQLPSLAYLRIDWPVEVDGCEEKLVQFHGYKDRIHDSNIWKMIPLLKTLIVDFGKRRHERQV